jgi:ankyrin repeat protein
MLDRSVTDAIFGAVERGDAYHVAQLVCLSPGVLEMEDQEECTPLLAAVLWGHTAVIAVLLGKGADVQAINDEGNSPLHLAARRGAPEIAELLLRHGADPLAKNEWDETPLMLAAEEGHLWVVARLLALTPPGKIDEKDVDGHTALACACLRGQVGPPPPSLSGSTLSNRLSVCCVGDAGGGGAPAAACGGAEWRRHAGGGLPH